MKDVCLICLGQLEGRDRAQQGTADYHRKCLRTLFGFARVPRIDVDLAKLHTVGLAMVGRATLSGVQRKISLSLEGDRSTLQLALGRGRYIMKPQASTFPALPENEHVTMRLAARAGIETPPCGLLRLVDGTLAYIVVRFDRTIEGRKLRLEDFCQLAGKPSKEKYDGSLELCARLLKLHATEPVVELLKLYRLAVFAWWTGNGDMHLKNFSVLSTREGIDRLSPAYDQLSTRLVIPDDDLALAVRGKRSKLSRVDWLAFGEYCGLPARACERVLAATAVLVTDATLLIERSFLDRDQRDAYRALLEERARVLASAG